MRQNIHSIKAQYIRELAETQKPRVLPNNFSLKSEKFDITTSKKQMDIKTWTPTRWTMGIR